MKNLIGKVVILCILLGCNKAFLDEQPNSSILTPRKADDFQRLLDNFERVGVASVLPQLSADEYYIVSEADWLSSRTAIERNTYVWEKDVYGGEIDVEDWNFPYMTVFYVNSILSEIEAAEPLGPMDKKLSDIYGQALFHRAHAYYDLLKNYSVPFDESTEATDLGVPIRLNPSVDYVEQRHSVEECYDLIFADLERSLDYLQFVLPRPERNRPTKLAVFALLSRIHLYRREYEESEKWADKVLKHYDKLIDYNKLDSTSITPFSLTNDELIMHGRTAVYNNARNYNRSETVFVDSALIAMYDKQDLRLSIYFHMLDSGRYTVKAGYNGKTLSPFNGLAVDEVMLNKIESLVRRNNLDEAATLINRLLVMRYKSGSFDPVQWIDQDAALDVVLNERRKELVWRCLRWDDIKRLNKEGANIVLRRIIGGKEYRLEPGSPRYVFNIPQDEINRSGIEQNQR